jgi:hypothetical protein
MKRAVFLALFGIAALSVMLYVGGCGESPGNGTESPITGVMQESSMNGKEAPVVTTAELAVSDVIEESRLAAVTAVQDRAMVSLSRKNSAVVGTATSYWNGRPCLLILTRQQSSGLPDQVEGVPAVQYVVGEITAQRVYCGTSTSRDDECAAGTLGAIVLDTERNYWLSNWHVFVGGGGRHGDVVDAPGRLDAGCRHTTNVGTVSRFVAVRFDGSTNYVDCAISRIIPGTSVSPIESAGGNSFNPVGDPVTPSVGLRVKKVGRTTGFTAGTVIATNVTCTVGYDQGSARFASCFFTDAYSAAGDSGSLFCTSSGNRPVGLLFAGNGVVSVGCSAQRVFNALDAHVAH